MAENCDKCNYEITDREWLKCCNCDKKYHVLCTTTPIKIFYLMKEPSRLGWRCLVCRRVKNNEDHELTYFTPPTTNNTPSSSTPREYVTMRSRTEINIPTNNTFSLLSSDEDEEGEDDLDTIKENCTIRRSCPNLTTTNSETLEEMKDTISKLRSELASADNEIQNMLLEKYSLEKKIKDQEKRISQLLTICKSVTTQPLPEKRKKKRASLFLNRTKLDFSDDDISRTINTSNMQPSSPKKQEKKDTTKITKTLPIRQQAVKNDFKKFPGLNNDNGIKSRVIILSDQQGLGLRPVLQKLLGDKYDVITYCKPGARIAETLHSYKEDLVLLTKNDYVVVIGFSNDVNPFKIQSDFKEWVNCVANTNVIVCETSYNKHLNETILNYNIKSVCTKFSNVSFVDLNYSNFIPKRKNFVVNLSRYVLREILRLSYIFRYNNRYNNKVFIKCENKSTQTIAINDDDLVNEIHNADFCNENESDFFRL